MESEGEYLSYKAITEKKQHHKLTVHEFLDNSCKMYPLISKKCPSTGYNISLLWNPTHSITEKRIHKDQKNISPLSGVESMTLGTIPWGVLTKPECLGKLKTTSKINFDSNLSHKWGQIYLKTAYKS